MSSAAPSGPVPHKVGLFQLIDWRFVATIGLPVWAFLIGAVVMHRTAPAAPAPAGPTTTAAVPAPPPPAPLTPAPAPVPAGEPNPGPREVIVRTEFQTVPVILPVPTPAAPVDVLPAAPAAPAAFSLPPSEVGPGDRCNTFDTKIRFHPDLPSAAAEAKSSKKMLLVLHISGNFDDPGFT
jgi:hypothetical protein